MRAPYLVLSLFLILVYVPPLSIITVSHFVWANKLDTAKVFGSLGNDTCYLGGHKKVHLQQAENTEKKTERNLACKNIRHAECPESSQHLYFKIPTISRFSVETEKDTKSWASIITPCWTMSLCPQPRLSKTETAHTAPSETLTAPFELIFNSFSSIQSNLKHMGERK